MPNCLVDFFRGEQQKNIDFAFLQALKIIGIDPDQGVAIIYDIACQYIVHLWDRIGREMPAGLTVEAAIGLFHVHAHKDSCFFRYATSLIPGFGDVAGEILEHLWSNLNAISPSARTATLAHRSEILDDHACDSNHKKALSMCANLCKRHKQATRVLEDADAYFKELTSAAGEASVARWEQQISHAEAQRSQDVKVMDIYAADIVVPQPGSAAVADAPYRSPMDQWMNHALEAEHKQ